MRRLYCFAFGFLLLTVGAEKDFQAFLTEQTKGTPVREDLLYRRENTIGHGTEAIPQENSHQHTASAVTAKFPGAALFDSRPMPPYETTQNRAASTLTASSNREQLAFKKGENNLPSRRDNPSAMRIHSGSEKTSISNKKKIVFSSTRAAFESMMNSTSEPNVPLSADGVKSFLWVHTQPDNRNQRHSDSVTLTSADGGPTAPVLSAYHPHVIDNLTALRNDNDDKRSEGEDGKGISNLGRDEYPSSAMQSIFQGDTRKDSARRNTATNLCFTCQKDRRAVSTEKSLALLALSPDGSLNSLRTEGPALDFNQFTASLHSLNRLLVGEQEEKLNKEIIHENITEDSKSSLGETVLSFNKTANQSILNNSLDIDSLLETGTSTFQELPLAETSSVTPKDTRKESKQTYSSERTNTAITGNHGSSQSLYTLRKPLKKAEKEMFRRNVSNGDQQSRERNASHSFSAIFKSEFLHIQPSDFSSSSVSNVPVIAEAPVSCRGSIHPGGNDHNTTASPTTRMIDAHSETSTKDFESHTLSDRADSLLSVLRGRSSFKDHTDKSASATTKRQLEDQQDSQRLSTVKSFAEQTAVDPSGSVTKALIPTFTTTEVAIPLKLLLSEPRRDVNRDGLVPAPTKLTSKSISERPAMERFSGEQSKITKVGMLDVSSDYNLAPTSQAFVSFYTNLISNAPRVLSPKTSDIKEQDAAKTEIQITESKGARELKEERGTMIDQFLESKREDLKILGILGQEKTNDQRLKSTDVDSGGIIQEGHTTLRLKDPTQVTKEGAEREAQTSTRDMFGEKGQSLKKEGAEVKADKDDLKHGREIGREGRTNSPLRPDSNSAEPSSDKGHPVTALSSCHSLIKQLGPTEHSVIHPSKSTASQKNTLLYFEVVGFQGQLHSTLKFQSPKPQSMPSFPKEPFPQIKLHPSEPKNHPSTSSSTTESAKKEGTATPKTLLKLSQTFRVSAATISPHDSAHKSTPSVPNSISNMFSVTTTGAQPHTTVNSSTLSLSIIQSIKRQKFSTSGLGTDSLLQTPNKRGQIVYFTQGDIHKSSVKGSTVIEKFNESTSVAPALLQQMQNDSSTERAKAEALSVETRMAFGQLQPHQSQSGPGTTLSSPFDMISGQLCSCELSKQTAHPDTLHAPVDYIEQKSVQAQMSSMSPTARNNQFPLSSTSSQLNLMSFGSDTLHHNHNWMELTSERDTGYGISGGGHSGSMLGASDEENQAEGSDRDRTLEALEVRHSNLVTKQMAENRVEKDGFSFAAQPTGRLELRDYFHSLSLKHTEELAVQHTNENNQNDLLSERGNNTVRPVPESNHLSLFEGYNETSAKPVTLANQPSRKMVQAINEGFVPVTSDSASPAHDTSNRTDNTGDSMPEIPIILANDVTKNTISDMQSPTEENIEKQHAPRGPMGEATFTIPLRGDLKIPIKSTLLTANQIMTVTSKFKIPATKVNDFVSVTLADSISSLTLFPGAHESALTTSEREKVVSEKSSQAAHAESLVQSNSLKKPEFPSSGKLTFALETNNTTEAEILEQPEHEILIQDIEQTQHAMLGKIEITSPINNPLQGVLSGLLNGAEEAHDTTLTALKRVEYLPSSEMETTTMITSAFRDQNKEHAPAPTSISQLIVGAATDSVPLKVKVQEMDNNSSCRASSCAKSDMTNTTTGAVETEPFTQKKMQIPEAAHMERDHPNAPDTLRRRPENASTHGSVRGNATPQAAKTKHAELSPATSKSGHGHASVDTMTQKVNSLTQKTPTKTWRGAVESNQSEREGTLEPTAKTTQSKSRSETAEAAEVIPSELEANNVTTIERTLPTEKNTITQFKRGPRAEVLEAQKATRSAHSSSKGETMLMESRRRFLLPESVSESELQRLKHERRSSPHLYVSGVTEVSDDLCGSGNYTAEMSLSLGRDLEPGDAVPALGNLRVIINLKTNNSRLNLGVTSCCLSPTIQPDLSNSTCCIFSRLAAEPAGITLLPAALPTSASFTISLFQMINYSLVYLHCDLSVCPRNRSDCERCDQQRGAFPSKDPRAVVTNLRNRISFGPMLKEMKNSSHPERIEPLELDLVLVIVSLVVGSSVVTVMLLLVWLTYRHRTIWLLQSATPPRACCCHRCCLRPGGDLILP